MISFQQGIQNSFNSFSYERVTGMIKKNIYIDCLRASLCPTCKLIFKTRIMENDMQKLKMGYHKNTKIKHKNRHSLLFPCHLSYLISWFLFYLYFPSLCLLVNWDLKDHHFDSKGPVTHTLIKHSTNTQQSTDGSTE